MDDSWLIIVNPNAGRRKAEKDWNIIENLLISEGFQFAYVFTKEKLHAVSLTSEYIQKGYRKFIAVGGDGTLNEVVNGIFSQKNIATTEFTLGAITIGTGNDWGRMYNIPTQYSDAIKTIKKGKTFVQDVGLINYFDSNEEKQRYFINMAGMGFDAQVAKRTNRQKEAGRRGGFSYLLNIFSALWSHVDKQVNIKIDSESFKFKMFTMSVGICKYNGNGMMQAPNAIPDDGLLDFTVIKDITKFKVVRSVHKLYDGSYTALPEVKTFQGKEIEIFANKEIFLEADGESLGHSPFKFQIIPKSIRVIIN